MKISVKEVLLESLGLYRKKLLPLLGVSLLITGLNLIMTAGTQLLVYVRNFSAHSILLGAAVALLFLVNIAIEPKVQMAAMNIINTFLNGESMSLREAYQMIKGKYFIMLLFTIFLALLEQLGNSAQVYLFRLGIPVWTSMAINFFYSICISTAFFALIPMIAIEPKTSHYIKKSTMLIKGNIPAVFALTSIVIIANFAIIYLLVEVVWSVILQQRYYSSPMLDQIQFAISTIVHFIVFPFRCTIEVSVYRRLTVKEEEPVVV